MVLSALNRLEILIFLRAATTTEGEIALILMDILGWNTSTSLTSEKVLGRTASSIGSR